MRIILINGNTSIGVSQSIGAAARSVCEGWPDISCEVLTPAFGPGTVEGYLDGDLAAVAVAGVVAQHRNQGDAFIIACFSDPGLFAAREITDKPVIGIAQASMLVAQQLGHSFSILTPLKRLKPVLENLVRKYGFGENCTSVETVDLSVSEAHRNKTQTIEAFSAAGQRAIAMGAEVVILGGAVLAGMEIEMSARLGVPVLDPVKCAVVQAVSLAKLGLLTSKSGGFAKQLAKGCKNCPAELADFYLDPDGQ